MSRYADAYAAHVQWQAMAEGVDLPSLTARLGRPEWQEFARCRGEGTGVFFVTPGADTSNRPGAGTIPGIRTVGRSGTGPAKAMCAECAVVTPCLEYALEDRSLDGVWGGTSTPERRRIRAGRTSAIADTEHRDQLPIGNKTATEHRDAA